MSYGEIVALLCGVALVVFGLLWKMLRPGEDTGDVDESAVDTGDVDEWDLLGDRGSLATIVVAAVVICGLFAVATQRNEDRCSHRYRFKTPDDWDVCLECFRLVRSRAKLKVLKGGKECGKSS